MVYESIGDGSATAGERGDTFFASARSANAKAMLTVPMIDWVARLGPGRSKLASFSVAKYGAQTGTDWQWFADAGNGVRTTGQNVAGNDPNDANVPSNSLFQQAWVQHLVGLWGTNASGGLRYFVLDNEPSLWHSTHRDVRPTGATDDIKNKMLDYAGKIKQIDPSALVVGPEGGVGRPLQRIRSAREHQRMRFPIATTMERGISAWLLGQLRQNNQTTGQRLIDVFTVHYYPQSDSATRVERHAVAPQPFAPLARDPPM